MGAGLKRRSRHFDYLSRKGQLDIETDDGQHLTGRNSDEALVSDWDLEIEVNRPSANLEARPRSRPPKLVHKVCSPCLRYTAREGAWRCSGILP